MLELMLKCDHKRILRERLDFANRLNLEAWKTVVRMADEIRAAGEVPVDHVVVQRSHEDRTDGKQEYD